MRNLWFGLVLLLAVPTSPPRAEPGGIAAVIDGDTLRLNGRRIRLFGVDAPEGRQQCRREGRPYACGEAAARHLEALISGRAVTCRQRDMDRHGRMVAICFAGGADLNRAMVAAGWALAYRRYGLDYVAQERRAQRARRGLWAGQFQPPWRWRAERR